MRGLAVTAGKEPLKGLSTGNVDGLVRRCKHLREQRKHWRDHIRAEHVAEQNEELARSDKRERAPRATLAGSGDEVGNDCLLKEDGGIELCVRIKRAL